MNDTSLPSQAENPYDPPGTQSSSRAAAPSLDIGRCFSDAIELYKNNFLILILAEVITGVLAVMTLTILAGPLAGGWVLMLLKAWERQDRRADIGDLFGAFSRFGSLAGLFYLVVFCSLLGIVLLVLPGLVLMTVWFFPFYLVIDKDMRAFDALGASFRIATAGNFGMLFVLVLVELALLIAPEFVPVAGIILSWLIGPLVHGIGVSAYIQLVREGGARAEELVTGRPASGLSREE